jgi:hypothetical protein
MARKPSDHRSVLEEAPLTTHEFHGTALNALFGHPGHSTIEPTYQVPARYCTSRVHSTVQVEYIANLIRTTNYQ